MRRFADTATTGVKTPRVLTAVLSHPPQQQPRLPQRPPPLHLKRYQTRKKKRPIMRKKRKSQLLTQRQPAPLQLRLCPRVPHVKMVSDGT